MLTNGREFRIYRIGQPSIPKMAWQVESTDDLLPGLKNLLGPDAVKKRAESAVDLGKPLAPGIGSRVRIVGGYIVYDKHTSTNMPINSGLIDGLRNTVSGVAVERSNGLILASLKIESAFSALDAMHEIVGLKTFDFKTADEFISKDVNAPTVFQNIFAAEMPAGTKIPSIGGQPGVVLPFAIKVTCYTQAVGFLDADTFQGTFAIDYDYLFQVAGTPYAMALPANATMFGEGRFQLTIAGT